MKIKVKGVVKDIPANYALTLIERGSAEKVEGEEKKVVRKKRKTDK